MPSSAEAPRHCECRGECGEHEPSVMQLCRCGHFEHVHAVGQAGGGCVSCRCARFEFGREVQVERPCGELDGFPGKWQHPRVSLVREFSSDRLYCQRCWRGVRRRRLHLQLRLEVPDAPRPL